MTIIWDEKGTIEIKVNKEKLRKRYYSQLGDNPQRAEFAAYKKIFLQAVDDFLTSKISVHELATVAGDIYYFFRRPFWFDQQKDRLGSVLSLTADLSFYAVRGKNNSAIRKRYREFLKKIKEYFLQNIGEAKKS